MIKPVVTYIDILMEGLELFSKQDGFLSLVERKERKGPALYVGSGEAKALQMDTSKSRSYHRLVGEVSSEEAESLLGGGDAVVYTYPMVCVAMAPKNVYNTDDPFIAEKICLNISNTIKNSNIKSLATDMGASSVAVNPGEYNIDPRENWGAEFEGYDYKVPSNMVLIRVFYDIVIEGDVACFTTYGCNDQEIDVIQNIRDKYCTPVTINQFDDTFLANVNAGDTYTLAGSVVNDDAGSPTSTTLKDGQSYTCTKEYVIEIVFADGQDTYDLDANLDGTIVSQDPDGETFTFDGDAFADWNKLVGPTPGTVQIICTSSDTGVRTLTLTGTYD